MRPAVALSLLLLAAPPPAGAQTPQPIPPATPDGAAGGVADAATVGCLGAVDGIRTALERSDDEVLRLRPGERALIESTTAAAGDLAAGGREDICLSILDAITPLVSPSSDLAEGTALGYASTGIDWPDDLTAFVRIEDLEGEDLYGQSDDAGGDRVSLAEVELGEVEGAVIRFGVVTHLVIDAEDGFFGIGSELRVVPIEDVRWNVEEERLEINETVDAFRDRAIVEEVDGVWVLAEPVEGGRVPTVFGH